MGFNSVFKVLNSQLNPICHLLALLGAHHIFHVSGLRVKHFRSSEHLSPICGTQFDKHWFRENSHLKFATDTDPPTEPAPDPIFLYRIASALLRSILYPEGGCKFSIGTPEHIYKILQCHDLQSMKLMVSGNYILK